MQKAFAQILRDGDTVAAERAIAPVSELFRLQGMNALRRQETEYLRRAESRPTRLTSC